MTGKLNVERAANGFHAFVEHMRINHGRIHIFMPQQFLHCPQRVATRTDEKTQFRADHVDFDGRLVDRCGDGFADVALICVKVACRALSAAASWRPRFPVFL